MQKATTSHNVTNGRKSLAENMLVKKKQPVFSPHYSFFELFSELFSVRRYQTILQTTLVLSLKGASRIVN